MWRVCTYPCPGSCLGVVVPVPVPVPLPLPADVPLPDPEDVPVALFAVVLDPPPPQAAIVAMSAICSDRFSHVVFQLRRTGAPLAGDGSSDR